MLAYLVWAMVGWTVVHADCGHCPTENIVSQEDLLQAQAYNAMPKDWTALPLKDVNSKGLIRVTHGYGPWRCSTPCVAETGSRGYTMCDFNFKHKINGVTKTYRGHEYCTKKYHDDGNRKCIEAPQWDESYAKMWCRTHYEGSVWNWSYTHFPICASTKKMCANGKKN